MNRCRWSGASPVDLWLALCSVPGLSRTRLHRLRERYLDAEQVFVRSAAELSAYVPPEASARIAAGPDLERARAQRARLEALGARVLLWADPGFPPLLRRIPDPPILLFACGELAPEPRLAIVGARRATSRGERVARAIAAEAARVGIVVASGLAHGIDAAAHIGALDGAREPHTSPGVAVWASGFDRPAPPSHARLARRILEAGGAWISEYPPGHGARPHQFPERNRLISGLAEATLVVEAAPRSGSLWTARHALEQGREVWVVPGPVDTAVCAGSNALLREGAAPVLEPADVLLAYGRASTDAGRGASGMATEDAPEGLSATAARIWRALARGPEEPDALARTLGIEAAALGRALVELELTGRVVRSGRQVARA